MASATPIIRPPELLAPAGEWEALRAAAANGADAVYFGLSNFNARRRAANFTLEQLPETLGYLHARNVRGYVTLNTLLFPDELAQAEPFIAAIAEAGADAVIVQDLGVARLVRRMAPELPVHASTQMSLADARGIKAARELGIRRVILARELSLDQIKRLSAETDMELEVFVHGALCVSASGQCLASETLGGRSANRGQCAQPCRLPYTLLLDGHPQDLGERRHLLSPRDLSTWDIIGRLIETGVAGLKIEGRLKSAHYVAAVTGIYRAAIDAACRGERFTLSPEQAAQLDQSFSRGRSRGYLEGVRRRDLVEGLSPKSRGVRAGVVTGRTPRGVLVALDAGASLKPGDGVVFESKAPGREEGGRLYSVTPVRAPRGSAPVVEITFAAPPSAAIEAGDAVLKSDDPALRRSIAATYSREETVRRAALNVRVRARTGEALRMTVQEAQGDAVEVAWPGPLQPAQRHPLDAAQLREQFGRLGDTPYELADVKVEECDAVMVPRSVLNALRREAVEKLLQQRTQRRRHAVADPRALETLRAEHAHGGPAAQAAPQLLVLARTPVQFEALLMAAREMEVPPALLYCDFRDAFRYREAVARGRETGVAVGIATLRVYKPGEEAMLDDLIKIAPAAVLARTLGSLRTLRARSPGTPIVADFSLNAANDLAAAWLHAMGAARVTPSTDMTWPQMRDMVRRAADVPFEIIAHQHVPMFHMEHCLHKAFLHHACSPSCNQPCRRHRTALRDRMGMAATVLPDAACRSTVFHGEAQSAAGYREGMLAAGVGHFRVELLDEDGPRAVKLVRLYAHWLTGALSAGDLREALEGDGFGPVTAGTFRAGEPDVSR